MRMLPTAILLIICSLLTASARADGPSAEASSATLTSRGRLMLAGSFGGFYTNDDSTGLAALYRWGVYFNPSVTYFVRDGLGIGGTIDTDYKVGSNAPWGVAKEVSFGVGFHLVYDIRLGERLSWQLWPSVSYHLAHQEDKIATYYSDSLVAASGTFQPHAMTRLDQDLSYPRIGLSLPFVYHASSSVGLGLGPYFYSEFALHGNAIYAHPSPADLQELRRTHRELLGVSSYIMASF